MFHRSGRTGGRSDISHKFCKTLVLTWPALLLTTRADGSRASCLSRASQTQRCVVSRPVGRTDGRGEFFSLPGARRHNILILSLGDDVATVCSRWIATVFVRVYLVSVWRSLPAISKFLNRFWSFRQWLLVMDIYRRFRKNILPFPNSRPEDIGLLQPGRSCDPIPVGWYVPRPFRPVLWPTQPAIHWVPVLYTGVKAVGAWRWPPTPTSAEVKERVELYLYLPSEIA